MITHVSRGRRGWTVRKQRWRPGLKSTDEVVTTSFAQALEFILVPGWYHVRKYNRRQRQAR